MATDCNTLISVEDQQNGKLDAASSSEYVNSSNPTLTTRLGAVKKTVQGMNDDNAQAVDDFNSVKTVLFDDFVDEKTVLFDDFQEQADNLVYTVGFKNAGLFSVPDSVASNQETLTFVDVGSVGEEWAVTAGVYPYTPNTTSPYTDTNGGIWRNVTLERRKTIASVYNVKDSQVIYHDDTITLLDDVLYIYDKSANQTTWSKPLSLPAGAQIVSIIGSKLTYNPGAVEVDLANANKSGVEFNTIADIDNLQSVGGKLSGLVIGDSITTLDYASGHNSGVLFFKVVAAGTGTDDGGKYIDLPALGLQLQQNLRSPYNVKAWGAAGNEIKDDTQSIINTKDASIGIVFAPAGSYLTSAEIQLDKEGIILVGEGAGSFKDDGAGYRTRIIGNHTTGSIVRIMLENCSVRDILLDATGDRLTAPKITAGDNYNGGLRVEAEDIPPPEGDVFDTELSRVLVRNQPYTAFCLIARCFGSSLNSCAASDNGGAGIVISNGEYTGRTNSTIAGIVDIAGCNIRDNQGHAIQCGNNGETDYTFRVNVTNSEGLYNCGDPSQLEYLSDSFYHCDGLMINNGAATGTDYNRDDFALTGIALKGLGGTLTEVRLLATSEPIAMLKTTRDSKGWRVVNPHIRETLSNHLVKISSGVENTYIEVNDTTGGELEATNSVGRDGLLTKMYGRLYTREEINTVSEILDAGNVNISSQSRTNKGVSTTPVFVFDASAVGKMWEFYGRTSSDPCTSSFTSTIVGGSVPAVLNTINQGGAGTTYIISIVGTDVYVALSGGSFNADFNFREVMSPDP